MTKYYTENTPAKINIGLRILSKRRDGYHNIETIFYPVNINDRVSLRIGKPASSGARESQITVKVNPPLKIKSSDNICYRAAKLFFGKFRIKEPYDVKISIKKNIPVGAGLGGGSSDAACILKILSKHFKVELIHKYLLNIIAAEVGADVPFFLTGRPAYGEGKGAKLTHLPDFEISRKILIVNPGKNISTRWAYKELSRRSKGKWNIKRLDKIKTFQINRTGLMINRFEDVVFKIHPAIGKIKEKMYKFGADFSLMSGSGSSVYGLFKKEADLKSARKYFVSKKYKTFVG